MSALIALSGAILRGLFGGMYPGVPRWAVYLAMIALAVAALGLSPGAGLVAIAVAAGFSPGHGSYLAPGNGSADDEPTAPLVRLLSRATPGSVLYCCVGMAVRYGLATATSAVVMLGCDLWLGASFGLWYGAVGLLAGPLMYALVLLHWERWRVLPFIDPALSNRPFEMVLGALIFAPLWWV